MYQMIDDNILLNLKNLRELSLNEQFGEKKQIYNFKYLVQLTKLELISHESRKRTVLLPPNLKEITFQQFLYDENCIKCDDIKNFADLNQLTKLEISKCQTHHINLPNSLKVLKLNDFPNLTDLGQIQRLTSLTSLSLGLCPFLHSVFLSDSVRFLSLTNCMQLETIKAYKRNYKLVVEGCYSLKNTPQN